MAVILNKIWYGYNILNNVWSDPRSEEWPLMGTPFPVFGILALYLYFVNTLGPRLMKDRKPFQLKKIMIIYNALQVVSNFIVFYMSLALGWGGKYRWICEPVDFSNSTEAINILRLVYFYFWIKLSDLIDTCFFILRKKQSHVSFLHVYHHTGMVVLVWSAVKYMPGGHGTSLGLINSMVHMIMYSYYLMTLINEKYKKSIWWKKHITQLQILQFLLLVLHFSTLVVTPSCGYPSWIAFVLIPQNLFMLILFSDFYIKTYVKKPIKRDENGSHDQVVNGVGTKQQNGFSAQKVQENGTHATSKKSE